MSELDKIKAEVAFYHEIGPLHEELEAAREVKASDPVRFSVAKQAFEERRTYWREIGEYLYAVAIAESKSNDSDVVIHTGVADVSSDAIAPFRGEG